MSSTAAARHGAAASRPRRRQVCRLEHGVQGMIMLIVAFVPLLAFWELGRVLGPRKLSALFFSKRGATAEAP